MDKIALTLLVIGGINWGCVGLFQFDLSRNLDIRKLLSIHGLYGGSGK